MKDLIAALRSYANKIRMPKYRVVVWIVLLVVANKISESSACIDSERQALLTFKQGIIHDPFNSLSSWGVGDCCTWARIVCDNVSGHVTHLQLGSADISGNINPSLLNLTHLTHLNLSYNHFDAGIQIPSFLGSLVSLTHLDLMSAGKFVGMIPSQLGNLSNLHHLLIGGYYSNSLNANNLDWIFGLSSLEHLTLSETGLQCAIPSAIGNLTSLLTLDLSFNYLQGKIPPSLGNLSNLENLDLSRNSLQGKIPLSLRNLCNVEKFDLSSNTYREKLSDAFQSLSGCLSNSLTSLDMSYNLFAEGIPDQIAHFKNLTSLSLRNNNLSGPIAVSLGSLSNLESLDISSNHLQGVVFEVHFSNLTNLKTLYASGNSITLSVTPGWTPPFDCSSLHLSDWNLGPQFPLWLKSQNNISDLELSNTGIADVFPSWFWNFSSQLQFVTLSHNHLRGVIPDLLDFEVVNLGFNELTGSLPRISSRWLDLSNNFFSGELSGLLCNPTSNDEHLPVIRLGYNHLQGNIPDCWEHWTELIVIELQNNYLIGHIPSSIGLLNNLLSLNLDNNSLTGEIPNSLKNCSDLRAINLGRNKLVGTIPRWIGSLPYLSILILHSNKVSGEVPYELCALHYLRILDVGDNNLYGAIPRCFQNAFAVTSAFERGLIFYVGYYKEIAIESAVLVIKGKEIPYGNILGLVTAIDLSSNNLSGEIPEELASLQALLFLNLSRNHLYGSIPKKIGNMIVLESLDLSWNNLSAPIPPSISDLSFLNFLNLSHNNFSGEIPKSTQLQSINQSNFGGNELLCGDPLPTQCRDDNNASVNLVNKADEEEYWFRLGLGVGFGVGFIGIIASLTLSRIWRRAYFWFFQDYIWYHILDCIIKIKYVIPI